MMPDVVRELAKTIENVDLGNVTVIDSGSGHAIAGAALGRARLLSESLATVEGVLGVHLRAMSKNIAGKLASPDPKDESGQSPTPPPIHK